MLRSLTRHRKESAGGSKERGAEERRKQRNHKIYLVVVG